MAKTQYADYSTGAFVKTTTSVKTFTIIEQVDSSHVRILEGQYTVARIIELCTGFFRPGRVVHINEIQEI